MASATGPAHADEPPPVEGGASDSAARERARAAFRKGVAQLRAQDWAGARASLEEAWGSFQHPSILLNLGIAHLRTDDPVLAEQDLVRFLSEDPGAAPEELSSAREALAEARSKIGTLRVQATPPSARVSIDGTSAPVRTHGGTEAGVAEARLAGGKHSVRVEADGYAPKTSEIQLPAKSETVVRVALVELGGPKRSASPSHSTTRTVLGWSLVGVSGLSFAASGFMGIRAMSLADDYNQRSSSSFQDRDVKDEGLTFRTGADIALVTAIVAGAAGAVLLLTDIGVSSGSTAAARKRALASGPSPRPSVGSASGQPVLLRW